MAAGYLSKPGAKYGPCERGCLHTDCAGLRRMANSICGLCGQPIGYEVRIYNEGEPGKDDNLAHAVCLEEKYG